MILQNKNTSPDNLNALCQADAALVPPGLLNSLAASSTAPSGLDRTGKVQDASVDMGIGMARSAKAMQLFNEVKADYEQTLEGVPEDNPEQQAAVLEPVHERSASKCLQLAMENGGIYNKAAQFVASLQVGGAC